jgi:hypothetical protein
MYVTMEMVPGGIESEKDHVLGLGENAAVCLGHGLGEGV